jgi:hypothetical protein
VRALRLEQKHQIGGKNTGSDAPQPNITISVQQKVSCWRWSNNALHLLQP